MHVSLVAKTDFIGIDDNEMLADFAAGICYNSIMRNDKRRIKNCIRRGHESVIEHLSATFLIEDISRACSHQIVRHRLASYSQQSQRYCDTGEWAPVIPPEIQDNEVVLHNFLKMVGEIKKFYVAAKSYGVLKEDARFILPNATPTTILVTMNLRNWRHFIEMRFAQEAQWEIRAVAKEILRILYGEYPAIFKDFYDQTYWEE